MAITPNERETIAAVDSISGASFYVEGTSSTGAINVNVSGSAGTLDENLAEVGGTAVAVNTGNANNGTQRVVIASDQPAIDVNVTGGGGGGTQYTEGATTSPGTGNLSLGRYKTTPPTLTDGQLYGLQLDSAGNLKVTGSISVGGTTDNSAYTAGSSTGTPAFGFYHSTIDTVTDGRSAAVAITQYRGQHVNLRNSSGTEVGTTSNPIAIQPPASGYLSTNITNIAGSSVSTAASGIMKVGVTDGTGNAITSTAGALDINIKNTSISTTQGTSPWIVAGGGTAGTAASGVVTVQGIASMTPVQVSQATASNLNATVVQGTATNLKTQAENYQGGTAVSSSNPLQVTLANTGSNATAVKVDGSAVTQPVSVATPTTIFDGKTTVTTAGTRVTLAASQAIKSVTIKALSTNTGIIYVGNSSVASTNGLQLLAGESVSMDIANLNTVNLDSSVNGEGVTYLAVA